MLTSLESRVINLLIPHAGIHEALLRTQLQISSVEDRKKDKNGFFTYFSIPAENKVNTLPDMILSGIRGTHPSMDHGVEFILFIRNGRVSILEAYSLGGESWPEDEDKMTLIEVYFP
jgi:hypothetical protein